MYNKLIKRGGLLLVAVLSLSSCSRNLQSNHYTANATSGRVYEGSVVAARVVQVGSDRLESNAFGGAAGAGLGGVAGSQIGHGTGSIAGAVGGALVGALAGSAIQGELSQTEAIEYIVKLEEEADAVVPGHGGAQAGFSAEAAEKIKKSKVVSVVQQDKQILPVGTLVYVIYSADRPRVIPR